MSIFLRIESPEDLQKCLDADHRTQVLSVVHNEEALMAGRTTVQDAINNYLQYRVSPFGSMDDMLERCGDDEDCF